VANHKLVVDTTGGADKTSKLAALQSEIAARQQRRHLDRTGITSSTVFADKTVSIKEYR